MAARQLISKRKTQAKAVFAAFVLVAVAVGIFAFPTQTEAQTPSDDATLSALTISPKDIIGFAADRDSYEVGVASTVAQATIAATANDGGASVVITPEDSNGVTDGHQVTLSAGKNPVTITVTAEGAPTTKTYTVYINQGVDTAYGWKASEDLDGLIAAGNESPRGVWSDGTTIWVSDSADDKLYAYNHDGTRNESQDFDTLHAARNRTPTGIWSNGQTMWVADNNDTKLYAYRMSDKQRDGDKDFETLDRAGNGSPANIWSDGVTMWVADYSDGELYAYRMSDQQHDAGKDFDTLKAAGNTRPLGIGSDGATMWVADDTDEKLYAYRMSDKEHDADQEFNTLIDAGNTTPRGIWVSGQTMWVLEGGVDKVYSYNMPLSGDATLSALTVSPKNIIGFAADRDSYEVGVASTVTEATIAATANDGGASVVITPEDSNGVTDGHQVTLSAGKNPVTITVTAEGAPTTKAYTVNINQGVDTAYGWKASEDLDGLIAAGNESPRGVWSDGTTIWVSDSADDKLYAYNHDGTRNENQDFDTLHAARNRTPYGIWSNGQTMWVADNNDTKLYAYRMSDKQRDGDKDFETLDRAGNGSPANIWSDGVTMWVADYSDGELYAYRMSDQQHDAGKDFDTLKAAGNTRPLGIGSDGATMWVADDTDEKLYAYRMSDKEHDADQEFNTLIDAGNTTPRGIWVSGQTMWVLEGGVDKVYSYNMPLSGDATLSALTVSPKDIIGFTADRDSYEVGVASTVAQATIAATANDAGASVAITPTDSNTVTAGHQVTLSDGRNTVTITVTAEDTTTVKAYTVNINRGVTTDFGWKASDDLDGLFFFGETSVSDVWRNDSTILLLAGTGRKIYAYNADGSRNSSKDVTVSSASSSFWTNGTTLWIVNSAADRLDGYDLSTKTRDTSKDFDTLTAAGNENPRAMWSDGTTMWVSDTTDDRIYAYRMSNTNRDTSKEFGTLDPDNQFPSGLYTDGTTMWVADIADGKLYAYRMSDKQRHDNRDFDTLSAAGNTSPGGMWADETTMLVVELLGNKVYSYNMPRSDDATLSALTVTPTNITGFRSDKTSYRVALASTVEQVTVAATANHESAASTITPEDAEDMVDGHQVDLSAGANTVTIRVTAENTDTKDYTINIYRGDLTTEYAWRVDDDINTLDAAGNVSANGIWSDGTHVWIADESVDKLYAYDAGTYARVEAQDFDTLQTAGNEVPHGIWSDGVTMWVADLDDRKLYAYKMSDKTRDETKDFITLHAAGNDGPFGIWSDGVTMWVSDIDDDKLYAYRMSDRERDGDRDFDTPDGEGNDNPRGIWSDGDIMWVTDAFDGRVYAYRMSDQVREQSKEFNTLSMPGNDLPTGIWSDETIMWVVQGHFENPKVYSYNLPASANANLSAITLAQGSGAAEAIPEFDPGTTDHDFRVSYDTEQVTVAGTAGHSQATGPVITPADADPVSDGHQVNLPVGDTAITLVVTAEDGSTRTYTVTVNRRPASDDADLSALTVSPKNINGFLKNRTSYEVGVASTVTEATAGATADDGGASVVITPGDSNDVTDGHQVTLSTGRNTVTITVTAEDTTTVKAYTVSINKGVTADYGWKAGDDLDGLIAAENTSPRGVWSNGTTIWVSDAEDKKIYAYRISDKARDPNEDFDTLDAASNDQPSGIWSDGMTMWVSDTNDDKIYAYNLTTKAHDASKDFDTLRAESNESPAGIWSDGTTMWVADGFDGKLYAYQMSNKERDSSEEFNNLFLPSFGYPRGIWSDGHTMWVANPFNERIYAYRMSDKVRDGGRRFDTLDAAGNEDSFGIWSDGQTMLVADFVDDKVYFYNMPASADATLSALTVSPRNIIGFDADRTSYEVGVASTVMQATVTAAANHAAASVGYSGTDADPVTDGRQVNLSAGRNPVTVTVTAEDGTEKTYTISINQGVADDFAWKAADDLDGFIASEVFTPTGIASDDSRFWVSTQNDLTIFAFNYLGQPEAARDITPASDNGNPTYLWADATTLFVVDPVDLRVYAYQLSDGARQMSRDFSFHTDNANPAGIWSDDVIIWVADTVDHKLYAYNLAGKVPDPDKNIDLDGDNTDPTGVASNGTTIWVADPTDQKVYAYTLQGGGRVVTKEINTLVNAGNSAPSGMSAGQDTIWINDAADSKTYTYNLPPATTPQQVAADATLSALTVSPKEINGFTANRTSYEVGVASAVTEATVAATANDSNATVAITPGDSNDVTDGHQVTLSAGQNTVTITVTAEDTTTVKAYTVNINRGVTDAYGWKASEDMDSLIAAGNEHPSGVWSDGTTIWVSDSGDVKLYAYRVSDKKRDSGKDFSSLIAAGNTSVRGIWSDGATMWVADITDDKLYAYRMSNRQRDPGRDFNTLSAAGNNWPQDIWSDGTTMWVADPSADKLYAYRMSDTERDPDRDFDRLSDAGNNASGGISSDGTTMWVSDFFDARLHAYSMFSKLQHTNRYFNTLTGSGNTDPRGIWSDEDTIWVVDPEDKKVYTYNMPPSNDGTLSSLNVNGQPVVRFSRRILTYQNGVASSVTEATVSATANHPRASLTITPEDSNTFRNGHQVALSPGANTVTIEVTAEDELTRNHTLHINRAEDGVFGWKATDDVVNIQALLGAAPKGITGHDGTFWISAKGKRTLFAFTRNGTYNPSRNISLHAANADPQDLWTDGEHIWVLNVDNRHIYVYQVADSARREAMEFSLHSGNLPFRASIWSDGATMWVSDPVDDKLYAYRLSDGDRLPEREFNLSGGNTTANAIWADGVHLWVADTTRNTLFAYNLNDGTRRRDVQHTGLHQLELVGGSRDASGMWSDGDTLWIAREANSHVYAYNMPPQTPTGLTATPGDARVTLAWDNPGRSAISRYRYRVSADGGQTWQPDWTDIPRSNARTTSHTVRGLANNFLHTVEIRAVEGSEQGVPAYARATPMGPPTTPPTPPTSLDVATRDGGLSLTWEKIVRFDPRAPVTGYHVRYRITGSSGRWTTSTRSETGLTRHHLVTGLTNRENYEVQVAAVNRIGTGPYASATNVPQAPPTPPEDPPGADDSLDVGALGGHWTDGPGNDNFHTDSHGLNMIFACAEPQNFRVFWHGPRAREAIEVGRQADEWQAHLITRGRAGVVSYQFRPEYRRPSSAGLYATVQLHGPGSVTVRVRGRFGDDGWGVWSDPMGFYCADEASHPARREPAQQAEPAPQDNQPATGQPAITGSPNPGETLGVDTSGLADPNGMTNAEFTYQWLRYDGSSDTGIAGAAGATYTVTDGDTGQLIKVRITFTDDADNQESISSYYVYVQTPQPLYGGFDADTVPGSHDGEATFTFQVHFSEEPSLGWEAVRDHVLQVTNGDVTGARRTTGGSNIRWDITLEPAGNNDVTVTLTATTDCAAQGAVCTSSGKMLSNQTGITVPGPGETQEQEETPANTAATGQPTINGTARVGETMTADTSGIADADGLDNAAFSYQWIRNDGNADSDISGATGATHTLSGPDEGKSIKVRVSFTDDGGHGEALTSEATEEATVLFWSATLTVGSSGTQSGYSLLENAGALSPSEFSVGVADYSVQLLLEDDDEMLHFGLDRELPTPFTLHIGTVRFAFEDANASTSEDGTGYTYQWDRDGLDWSVGEDVALSLTMPGTPLTASFGSKPSNHDGQTAFTFELRFSEEFGISYQTLRDHAFTVTRGTVEKAQRLDKPSNILWRITVEPDSNAAVTVVLPITENCGDQGAVCTEDGRMLSSRLELTVSGPGQ